MREKKFQYRWEPARMGELAASIAYKIANPSTVTPRDYRMIGGAARFIGDAQSTINYQEGQKVRPTRKEAYRIVCLASPEALLKKKLGVSADVLHSLMYTPARLYSRQSDTAMNFFIDIAKALPKSSSD